MITRDQMAAAMPRANLEDWYGPLVDSMTRHAITTPRRNSDFLGNVAEETGELTVLEENLHYSGERLMAVFPSLFRADKIKANAVAAGGPEAVANFIYSDANRPVHWGLGNVREGDGWLFRGRGPMQLTGRDAYTAFFIAYGLPADSDPSLLLEPKYGAESAAWIWQRGGCNDLSDQGLFLACVQRMNGGYTNLNARKVYRDAFLEAQGVDTSLAQAA